jgi:hypothetical protein
MKNYIKFGIGVYIGWHIAKTIDMILSDFIKTNFIDKKEKQGETVNDRAEE